MFNLLIAISALVIKLNGLLCLVFCLLAVCANTANQSSTSISSNLPLTLKPACNASGAGVLMPTEPRSKASSPAWLVRIIFAASTLPYLILILSPSALSCFFSIIKFSSCGAGLLNGGGNCTAMPIKFERTLILTKGFLILISPDQLALPAMRAVIALVAIFWRPISLILPLAEIWMDLSAAVAKLNCAGLPNTSALILLAASPVSLKLKLPFILLNSGKPISALAKIVTLVTL